MADEKSQTQALADDGAPQFARWTVLLLALGIVWRVTRYLLDFPFWGDETFTNINILRRGYLDLAGRLEYAQVAPLLFLWAQRTMYLLFGGGEYALRAVPLAAGVAALVIFWRFARRLCEPRAAAIAVGFFAATYALVRHTCETKCYSTDMLTAAALLWVAIPWQQSPRSIRHAVVATAAAAVGIWLSYPAVFVVGGIGLALLWPVVRSRSWRAWGLLLGYGAVTAASFALFYVLVGSAQADYSADAWMKDFWSDSFPPTTGVGALLWWLVKIHAGRMLAYPTGGPNFGSSATAVLCSAGVIALVLRRRPLVLLLLLGPAVPTMLAAVLHRFPYGGSVRVAIHLAPAICILAGIGSVALIDLLPRKLHRRATAALALILAAFSVLGTVRDVLHPYKTPLDAEVRRVIREVTSHIDRDDVVMIVNPPYGTYGPPDGPIFHQSLRYYLELRTGVVPRWCSNGPPDEHVNWLLAYTGPDFGPTRDRVEFWAAQGGLEFTSVETYPLSDRSGESLSVYRCTPRR